jgi:hypothetical protein
MLKNLTFALRVEIGNGELLWINNAWYVTHSGLLRLSHRRHCSGIHTQPVLKSSDPVNSRWVFKATVFKSPKCKGFTDYGDADPSNVSPLVRGAEMRVAETRAVNRALRKAYGIGICSLEEIGSSVGHPQRTGEPKRDTRKLPPIESAQFLPHSGIRFPQNPCSSCPYTGLCLGKQPLVDAALIRRPGAQDFGVFDELTY